MQQIAMGGFSEPGNCQALGTRIHVLHKGADIPVGEKDVFHIVG